MKLQIEDLGIYAKYELEFDLDHEGAMAVMPSEFFDAGEFIGNDLMVRNWLKNGGRERLQEYFLEDVVNVSNEINPKHITIHYSGIEV